jgi:hypothetical protein
MSSCSDWMACTVPFVACTVPLVASVSYGRPCLLTLGMSCQYDPVWEKGALHGVVGAGVRRGPATTAAGLARGWLLHEDLALSGVDPTRANG